MTSFRKNFIKIFLIQTGFLSVIAIAFFAGGPEPNVIRAMIAFLGMALLFPFALIGITSPTGIVFITFVIMLAVSYFFSKLISKSY